MHAGKHMVSVNSSCLQFSNSRAMFESPFPKPSWIFSAEFIEVRSRNFISYYEQ